MLYAYLCVHLHDQIGQCSTAAGELDRPSMYALQLIMLLTIQLTSMSDHLLQLIC